MFRTAALLSIVGLVIAASPSHAKEAKKLKYGDRSAPIEARADQLDGECRPVLERVSKIEGFPDHTTPYNARMAVVRDTTQPAPQREVALGEALVVCFAAGGMK